jgi:membrane protein
MARSFRIAFQHAIAGFDEDELLTRAAAIAFYSALSIAPILLMVLWALSLLGTQSQDDLSAAISAVMGEKAAAAVLLVVNSAKSRPVLGNVAGTISIGVTVFSASAVFAQLQTTLNRIWRIEPVSRGVVGVWLKARARAFGLLIGIAFLLVISFVASALIHMLIPHNAVVWSAVEYLVSFIVFVTAFGAMYRVLPDTKIARSDAVWGGLLTTILFIIGKYGIELYIGHASIGGAYGPAGALVVMLTWVYYASFVVLLGAELTHGIAMGRKPRV